MMKFFKELIASAKFGKAQGLVVKKRYKEAHIKLNALVNSSPPDHMLMLIHALLGEVEYNLRNYKEARSQLELCIKDSVQNPSDWEIPGLAEILERVHWFYRESEIEHTNSTSRTTSAARVLCKIAQNKRCPAVALTKR